MARNNLQSTSVTPDFTTNDAFNVCAIAVGRYQYEMLVVAFYRTPWESVADTKKLYNQLDFIVINYSKVVIVGDFNIPNARFDLPSCTETDHIHCFVDEHDLHLLKPAQTLGLSIWT